MAGLDAQAGKAWDDASDRLHAGLLLLAKQSGFRAEDPIEVAFNTATGRHAQGELVHLRRSGPGASPDPVANRAHAVAESLLAAPATESYEKAWQIEFQQQTVVPVQGQAIGQPDTSQQHPVMRM